jgi:TPR repeat protein
MRVLLKAVRLSIFALFTALIAMIVVVPGTVAGPFDDGIAAVSRRDYATAMRIFRPMADRGLNAAQLMVGTMYDNGWGAPQNYAEAMKWYRLAADQGDAAAQSSLGSMFNNGRGVRQSYAEALKWYRLAAEQGYSAAQYSLGLMYAKGQGAPQNYGEAVKWYRLAADQGDAYAQTNLGYMFDKGFGVPQNFAQALNWFRKAAEQGDVGAQTNLGAMYYNGKGVAQNYPEAMRWYRKAADQGNASAQDNLGLMYYNGHGVPQNYVQAHMWFSMAADNPASEQEVRDLAVKNRNLVASKMTPGQIAQVPWAPWVEDSEIPPWEEDQHASQTMPTQQSAAVAWYSQLYNLFPNLLGDRRPVQPVPISMQLQAGTYTVPVLVNNAISLNFVVDSGAADVSIPADVVGTLFRTGTLTNNDFLGKQTYTLADGSTMPSATFRIRSLKVGNKIVENVTGSVAPMAGGLLLGQSFLSHFSSWSIDNAKHALILE